MIGPSTRRTARNLAVALSFGALTGGFGALGGAELLVATLALFAIAFVVWERWGEAALPVWLLAGASALGVAALGAGPLYYADLLAGGSGLLLVAWVATSRPRPTRFAGRPLAGLLLPGLVVAVALAVPLLLPPGPDRLGIAVAVLVGLLAALAAAIGYSGTGAPGAPALS